MHIRITNRDRTETAIELVEIWREDNPDASAALLESLKGMYERTIAAHAPEQEPSVSVSKLKKAWEDSSDGVEFMCAVGNLMDAAEKEQP